MLPDEQAFKLKPLGAGRAKAGKALMKMLHNDNAPRLCLVTGAPGAGKTHLLAWLIATCTAPETPPALRVHAQANATGMTVDHLTWLLAQQLHLFARTPDELVAGIARDPRRTVIVVAGLQDAKDIVAGLLDPLLALPHVRLVAETAQPFTAVTAPAVMDLDDSRWTDRVGFDRWYQQVAPAEQDADAYPYPGNVVPPIATTGEPDTLTPESKAYRAAAMALCDESDEAVCAAVLRARLLGLDDVGVQALNRASVDAPWEITWAHWPGTQNSPGPVVASTAGRGAYEGKILLADPAGIIRVIDRNGNPAGRIPVSDPRRPSALAQSETDTVLLSDAGELLVIDTDDRPVYEDVQKAAANIPGRLTALTVLPDSAWAFADATGSAYAVVPGLGGVVTTKLHEGPVTVLAAAADGVPVLFSGGADGRIRVWGPESAPMSEPFDGRPCPVTALAVRFTPDGLFLAAAWSDGLIRVHRKDTTTDIRIGSFIHAATITTDSDVVLGLHDGVVNLRIRS